MRRYNSVDEAFIGEVGVLGLDEFSKRLQKRYVGTHVMREVRALSPILSDSYPLLERQSDSTTHGFKIGGALGVFAAVAHPSPRVDATLRVNIHSSNRELIEIAAPAHTEPDISRALIRHEMLFRAESARENHPELHEALDLLLFGDKPETTQLNLGIRAGFGYLLWLTDRAEIAERATPIDLALFGETIDPSDDASFNDELFKLLDSEAE